MTRRSSYFQEETMPTYPKRPCSFPGCPNLTSGQYCDVHRTEARRRYDKYERSPDVHKQYGRAWKRIRDRYILAHPYCEKCFEEGRMTVATECHHIIPVSRGGQSVEENLMALCRGCHNKIHHELGDR